ncbi:hypothetical protein FRZ67_17275 [Panacibacter ginsenosidivorans]|uniref:Uncharacterized protein n=1 Tax=Panacibacter ginsenosidivorans TaxID=1813871 RepID=A0A5B8VC16_9BACT|nr:hypothetical protein [Panacibacter ginsenosidivorans]QEC68974.1 hypothetical protein FRZ67_17275 [Panacibacter ginsenosidivorans]
MVATSSIKPYKMIVLLIVLFSLNTKMNFSQVQTNTGSITIAKGQLLDSIFPIDNIVTIKVKNYSGIHTLTTKEFTILKEQLKKAKFAGGLLIKPGHIILEVKLKDNTFLSSGLVYASTGAIHFDDATDKNKNKFSGTFYLPTKLNFDNYK